MNRLYRSPHVHSDPPSSQYTALLLFQFDSYQINSLWSYSKGKGIPVARCREAALRGVANSPKISYRLQPKHPGPHSKWKRPFNLIWILRHLCCSWRSCMIRHTTTLSVPPFSLHIPQFPKDIASIPTPYFWRRHAPWASANSKCSQCRH